MHIRQAAFAVVSLCALAIAGCGSGASDNSGGATALPQAGVCSLPHTLVGEDYAH
ncbi:hypothetical protein GCM10011579_097740 [Streptomyces albiflavescens]|uniref:Lipoprotein n=1 Tax=Streptomyces albiflavescens TaxID=1623582 RepID=A0A917YHH4_9ACTN|nr:hypothetical protein [Streptomyces albiflavescens]GGN96354.1 hypothetical protein GCM10011579_097740 [Streptomyces albiflavescens]